MEENGIWESKTKVRSFDVDKNKRLSIVALTEYLQEEAGSHANAMGFGYRQVIQQDMVWILNGIRVEIEELPMWEDEIFLKTWVVGNNRFISRRDFICVNQENNVLFRATTNWILFNTKTLRPQLVDSMNFSVEMHPNQLSTSVGILNMRGSVEDNSPLYYEVKYSDLDMVGHMNNTKYIQLLLDYYKPEFHGSKSLKSLEIIFKAEAKYEDKLDLYSQEMTPNNFSHELKRPQDSKTNFLARLVWE